MTLKIFGLKVRFLKTLKYCNFGNHTRTHQVVVPVILQLPFGVQQKPYDKRVSRASLIFEKIGKRDFIG